MKDEGRKAPRSPIRQQDAARMSGSSSEPSQLDTSRHSSTMRDSKTKQRISLFALEDPNNRRNSNVRRKRGDQHQPPLPPTAPSPPRKDRIMKIRRVGLRGTKFDPRSGGNSSPGAHKASLQLEEEPEITVPSSVQLEQEPEITVPSSLPPSLPVKPTADDGVIEVTAVAKLVTSEDDIDEEAIRQKAEKDAEKRLLSNIARAEVVIPDYTDPDFDEKVTWCGARRRWVILSLVLLLLVLIASVTAATRRKSRLQTALIITPAPTLTQSPSMVPSASPTNQPSVAPSMFPTDPFTNDFCQGARELESGLIWSSSTLEATLDEGFGTCGDIRTNGRGQWYTIEGQNAWLRVHTCHDDTNFDTQLSVYKDRGLDEGFSSCLSAICVTGNDQFCGDQSYVQWFGEAGMMYYVLVHGYRHYTGDFTLEVIEEKNEVCESALNISQPIFSARGTLSIDSSLERAAPIDPDKLPQCGGKPKPSGIGIWYTYDGSNDWPTISIAAGLSYAVYTGSCDRLACAPVDEWGVLQDAVGVTYTILVYGKTDTPGRENSIMLSLEWAQFSYFIPPVGNSYCDGLADNPDFFQLLPGGDKLFGDTTHRANQAALGSCGDSVYMTSGGLWYSVVGTGRPMMVTTCTDQADSMTRDYSDSFDTQISVFEGSCDNLVCIDGNDQYCGDQSAVSWFTTRGVVYSVLVHGYGTRSGAFEVSYQDVDLFGNAVTCDEAVLIIPDGTSTLGTAILDEPSPVGYCGFGGDSSAGSWFRAIGTGQSWTASTCGSSKDFTARISVYEGDGCSSLNCVAAVVSPCGDQNAVTWKTTTDKPYYILVHGKDGSEKGKFALTLEETTSNDNCNGAIGPLRPDGVTKFGSTRSATFDDRVPDCGNGDRRTAAGRGVFYSVAGSGGNMTVSTCSPFTNHNMQLTVYSGDCDNLKCVNVETTGCLLGADGTTLQGTSATWTSAEDELYTVLVHGTDEETGNFGLEVVTLE